MKTCKYIVSIKMPKGDMISAEWLKDLILCDCNAEDEGRDDVSVVEIPVNEDLEEAAEKLYPEKKQYVSPFFGTIEYTAPWFKSEKDAFIAGANWQKEKMLKDAVEADVADLNGDIYNHCIEEGLTDEDKVKIVIVKEDIG